MCNSKAVQWAKTVCDADFFKLQEAGTALEGLECKKDSHDLDEQMEYLRANSRYWQAQTNLKASEKLLAEVIYISYGEVVQAVAKRST